MLLWKMRIHMNRFSTYINSPTCLTLIEIMIINNSECTKMIYPGILFQKIYLLFQAYFESIMKCLTENMSSNKSNVSFSLKK